MFFVGFLVVGLGVQAVWELLVFESASVPFSRVRGSKFSGLVLGAAGVAYSGYVPPTGAVLVGLDYPKVYAWPEISCSQHQGLCREPNGRPRMGPTQNDKRSQSAPWPMISTQPTCLFRMRSKPPNRRHQREPPQFSLSSHTR